MKVDSHLSPAVLSVFFLSKIVVADDCVSIEGHLFFFNEENQDRGDEHTSHFYRSFMRLLRSDVVSSNFMKFDWDFSARQACELGLKHNLRQVTHSCPITPPAVDLSGKKKGHTANAHGNIHDVADPSSWLPFYRKRLQFSF